MCGCFAGLDISINLVIKNLRKLIYRGADASGIGFFDIDERGVNSGPKIVKKLGKSLDYIEFKGKELTKTHTILGHCRWSSQGKNSIDNTHPFSSFDFSTLLIHNGQLENSREIQKKLLENKGISQKGETDSETATNWWADKFNEKIYPLLAKSFEETFKGTWAIIFLHNNSPDKIFFLVKDSPLYYYNGQLSSDPSIFPLYYTIPNNSWGWVSRQAEETVGKNKKAWSIGPKYQININGKYIGMNHRTYTKNKQHNMESAEVTEGDKMLKEIKEQATLEYIYPKIINKNFDKIHIFGCGSSRIAADLVAKYLESTHYIRVHDAAEYNYIEGRYDVEIAISQSGETADVISTIKDIPDNNKILLVNRKNSTASLLCSTTINVLANLEESVAATKTFTATVIALLSLLDYNDYQKILLDKLKLNIKNVLSTSNTVTINNIAKDLLNCKFKNCLVLGSNLNYYIAQEVALKITEVAYIHADSLLSANLKHGYLTLAGLDTIGIFILGDKNESKYERVLGNIEQMKSRGSKIVGIGPNPEPLFDWYIETPYNDNQLCLSILNNINGQLLSYFLSKNQGIDMDFPRNLAKSLTVY